MERPSPVPPNCRVVELSACTKGWNRRASCCCAQPNAGVGHGERYAGTPAPERQGAGAHPHAAVVCKLDGIAQQVEQNLPYPCRIPDQSVLRAGIDLGIESETFSEHLRPECI